MALLSLALALCLAARVSGVAFTRGGADYGGSDSSSSSDYGAGSDPTEVLSVPGFDAALPSRHYAGYVDVDQAHGRRVRVVLFRACALDWTDATRTTLTRGHALSRRS